LALKGVRGRLLASVMRALALSPFTGFAALFANSAPL
jgi:hypothetical protein